MSTESLVMLHIIGTGCPDARAERYGSAFGLESDGKIVLIDCGPATTYKMALMGLNLLDVDHLFFTHHHFDHNADLACFALSRWDQSIAGEMLNVYGPYPTEEFVAALLGENGAFAIDWKSRLEHPASHVCHTMRGGKLPRPAPAVQARNLESGTVIENEHWSVKTVQVKHVEPTMISLAYRFDLPGSSIVFAGDCADCSELRQLAEGADTLVMACTHFSGKNTRREIADVITGTVETAAIACEAGVKKVVLTHMSPNFVKPGERERAVVEVARSFSGEIFCPDELSSIVL